MNSRLLLIPMLMLLGGCGYLGSLVGLGPDPERIALERRVAMLERRNDAALAMTARLAETNPLERAPMLITISERAVRDVLQLLREYSDTLDDGSSYVIRSVAVDLAPGSAIVTMEMEFDRPSDALHANLLTDCLLSFDEAPGGVAMRLVPFNISPYVEVDTWLPGVDAYAEALTTEQIAKLESTLPPLNIPLSMSGRMEMTGVSVEYHQAPALVFDLPGRPLGYTLRFGGIYIFDRAVVIVLSSIEVHG
jgi:hypothetical protein